MLNRTSRSLVDDLLAFLQISNMNIFRLSIQSGLCVARHEILEDILHVAQNFLSFFQELFLAEVRLFLASNVHQQRIHFALQSRGI